MSTSRKKREFVGYQTDTSGCNGHATVSESHFGALANATHVHDPAPRLGEGHTTVGIET